MKRMIQAEISIGTQVEHRQLSQSNNEIFCKKRQSKYSPQRDNGTNFVGAEREVEEYVAALNKEGIEEHLVQRGISWKFNPPAAPFSLGVWERFLRRCEKTMYAVLGNRSVREDVLSTTMCIVEETLKARPLTPVSSDVNDLEAMTPNHFLLGNRNVCLPYLPEDIKASTQNMGTAFKGAFNRSTWKPVNIFGKYKLKLQQAEAKPQSLECSTQQKLHFDGVGIIFGQHAYELQRPLNYKIGKRSELFAVLTELGWVVSGPMTGKIRQTVCHFVFTEDVKEAENIQYWWDIETYASKINVVTQSKTEVQRQKMLEVTKNFTGERYEVEMLWTESEPNLRNNYSSTLGQLYSLEQKIQRDPNLKSLY